MSKKTEKKTKKVKHNWALSNLKGELPIIVNTFEYKDKKTKKMKTRVKYSTVINTKIDDDETLAEFIEVNFKGELLKFLPDEKYFVIDVEHGFFVVENYTNKNNKEVQKLKIVITDCVCEEDEDDEDDEEDEDKEKSVKK